MSGLDTVSIKRCSPASGMLQGYLLGCGGTDQGWGNVLNHQLPHRGGLKVVNEALAPLKRAAVTLPLARISVLPRRSRPACSSSVFSSNTIVLQSANNAENRITPVRSLSEPSALIQSPTNIRGAPLPPPLPPPPPFFPHQANFTGSSC